MITLVSDLRWYGSRIRFRYLDSFVFVHINKTGGTSVEKALGLRFEHRTALDLRRELGERRWDRRFTFAFVRNPWDKVKSHYFYRVQTDQTGLGGNPIPFPEWVELAYGERDPRYYDSPLMFAPQLEWLTDDRGEVIVKFIGRFERLDADFQKVCRAIGRDARLPHLKRSVASDYRTVYTPEAAEIVARHFASDIEYFGYTFD